MAAISEPLAGSGAARLRRLRRIASAVLVVLALLFLATFALHPAPHWVLLLRSMAEAGMVGGLADWFAVTALFRHPLGLPISHTALLPRKQAQVAGNAGRFFGQYFLEPQRIRTEALALSPGRILTGWLQRGENSALIARELRALLAEMLRRPLPPALTRQAQAAIRSGAVDFGDNQKIAQVLVRIAKDGFRSKFADQTIGLIREAIDQRRDVALEIVQDNSRWWIAAPVDRRAADLVVGAVLSLLDDLQRDASPARRQFLTALDAMTDQMLDEGVLRDAIADARRHLARSGAAEQQATALARQLRDALSDHLAGHPEQAERLLALAIRQSAAELAGDQAALAILDRRIADLAARIIGNARGAIAAYVAGVIKGWSPQELNARFEEEIGPDLQFIRINGAAFGAMIGGALFALEAALG